jgi:putative glycosyltransferase (TIGR04372 family)
MPLILIRKLKKNLFTLYLKILYLPKVIIFLIKNKNIYSHKIIYLFATNSFGHQNISFDYVSRLYWPNKIALVQIIQNGNNKYLGENYSNFVIFSFYSNLYFNSLQANALYCLIRFLIKIQSLYFSNVTVVEIQDLYKTLSTVPCGKKLFYGGDNGVKKEEYNHTLGRKRLIYHKIGVQPVFPLSRKNDIIKIINNEFPTFFLKPFILILLRNKEEKSIYWNSRERNPKNQSSYKKSIKYIIDNGYHVVGSGETDNSLFSDIKGYFNFSKLDIDNQLINLFLLSECSFFIGQNSGPIRYLNSISKPSLITNMLPHWSGTDNPNDLILHKVFIDKNCKDISLFNLIINYTDLFYGVDVNNYEVRDNTEDEIYLAVKELLNGISNPYYYLALERYHKLIPSDTLAFYTKNRVPDFTLDLNFTKDNLI